MVQSSYKVCDKCGVRYSTLTRHRCLRPPKQKNRPKFDDAQGDGDAPPGGGGGPDESDQGSDQQGQQGQGEGQGQNQGGQGQDKGEGEGEGQGQGQDGDGQNEQGDGQQGGQKQQQGQGQGQGEGEGQGQQQAEEPPPTAIVITVMKFAALTAQSRGVAVMLTEDGLLIMGGDGSITRTMPWKEVEDRATLDGEYYVKEQIDEVAEEVRNKR